MHANSDTRDAHIFRELIQQGYSIISPDYRGSTGYGRGFYEQIDYGAREVDDVYLGGAMDAGELQLSRSEARRHHRLEPWRADHADEHLRSIRRRMRWRMPGVPVSDLVMRLGYEPAGYQALYSAPYHIGKTVREDIQEYRRRSPVTHAKELATPLLIHTNTNDEDVNVLEVEHLIQALKAEGKKFEYKIYQDAPGRPLLQPHRHQSGQGVAGGDLAIPGGVFEAGEVAVARTAGNWSSGDCDCDRRRRCGRRGPSRSAARGRGLLWKSTSAVNIGVRRLRRSGQAAEAFELVGGPLLSRGPERLAGPRSIRRRSSAAPGRDGRPCRRARMRSAPGSENRVGAPCTTSATSASDCSVRGPRFSRSSSEAKSRNSRS